jgi:ribose transport system substrate-binding protein
MKKTGLWLMIVIMCLYMLAAFSLYGSKEEEEAAPEEKIVVAHLGVRHGFPYRIAVEDTIRDEAERLGIELIQYDNDLDIQKAFDQIEDAMLQNPDVLIVPVLDAKAYIEPLKKAHEKGFKIVTETASVAEEGYPYIDAYVGSDPETQGRLAAELMVQGLKEKFGDNISGRKIVIIEGHPGEDAQIFRSKGFEDRLAEIASGVEILDKQAADWSKAKALDVMEDYLVKYKQIDGFYSQDDTMAVGAIEAIKEAGRLDEIIVVGINGNADGLTSIKNGEMYGTISQSPVICGKLVVQVAHKLAKGEDVEFFNIQPMPKITIENADEFLPW